MSSIFKRFIYKLYFETSRSRKFQSQIKLFMHDESFLTKKLSKKILTNKLSRTTNEYLKIKSLSDSFKKAPLEVLNLLCNSFLDGRDRNLCFVLAELCFYASVKIPSQRRKLLVSCAFFSYNYIFSNKFDTALNYFSPDLNTARNYYNFSLAYSHTIASKNHKATKTPFKVEMFNGTLEIVDIKSELLWNPDNFDQIFTAYDFEVKGFFANSRELGIGVPLVLVKKELNTTELCDEEKYLIPVNNTYAASSLMRITEQIINNESKIECKAKLDFLDPYKTVDISINNIKMPLQADFSTPLAYMLNGEPVVKNMSRLLEPGNQFSKYYQGINMMIRYEKNKIPVVFIHGLLSTARTWEQAVNYLLRNQTIRKNCQFWFFSYPTGNPIIYSAHFLRQSLKQIQTVYDENLENKNFNNMVLVGHSMGGLLSKLMTLSVKDEIIGPFAGMPLEQLGLPEALYNFVKEIIVFERLPYVKRCIFLSVPHRGSSQASSQFSKFSSNRIELPADLKEKYQALTEAVKNLKGSENMKKDIYMRTGIEGLREDNPFLSNMCKIKVHDEVKYHSIIGNVKNCPKEESTDSIVPYSSSHLDYTESEFIVKCNHATQKNPAAISEIERILLKHIESL